MFTKHRDFISRKSKENILQQDLFQWNCCKYLLLFLEGFFFFIKLFCHKICLGSIICGL